MCLVPLFVVVHRASWAAAPFYGMFFGYLSYALFNYWLGKFHPLTLVVVPPIYAAYFLVLFPALKLADFLFPSSGFILQSTLWVCYEYFLKSNGFLAFSYGNLGYSQYPFIPFIQIADALGIWGVSLMVVFPSALIGSALSRGLARLRESWRSSLAPAASIAIAFAAVVVYGLSTQVDLSQARQWKVALVQQNWIRGGEATRPTASPSTFSFARAGKRSRRTPIS